MNKINTKNNRKLIDGVYLIRHDDTAVLFVGQGLPLQRRQGSLNTCYQTKNNSKN